MSHHRAAILLWSLLLTTFPGIPLFADIYYCEENGATVARNHPCKNSEKILEKKATASSPRFTPPPNLTPPEAPSGMPAAPKIPRNADQLRTLIIERGSLTKEDAELPYTLGVYYLNGQGGVRPDIREALRWLTTAGNLGHTGAQFHLGTIYQEGKGLPADPVEAERWYHRAADLGDPKAQNNLGLIYMAGAGVLSDFIIAHMWFSLAAQGGNSKGDSNRSLITRYMNADQIARAQDMAKNWRPRTP
ncbi:MAG: sel1 repeat family protein [Magnetococcales bacterium]|nr:sel1 repeat family protein [Magnetococcales bacterium]